MKNIKELLKWLEKDFSIFAALIACVFALSQYINFNKELLYKYGLTMLGALVAVVYASAVSIFYRRFKEKSKPRIFISYNHKDEDFAVKLAEELKRINVKPIIDRFESATSGKAGGLNCEPPKAD